jgi:AcrR family transcriptional regulator
MSDKKEQIKKTASRLFLEKGFRRARMSDIAAEAGIAVGTLYQYYPTKQALFDSLNMPFPADYPNIQVKKKKAIVIKALSVFGEYGYEGTTMDMIATVCNLSKPALYQYYASKKTLFIAIFSETDFMKELPAIPSLHPNLPVASILREVGLKFIFTLLEPKRLNLMRTAFTETRRFPEIGQIIYEQAIVAVSGHLSRYLKQSSANGILCIHDPVFTARAFLGQLFSFVVLDQLLTNQPEFNPESVVNKAVDLILHGILKGDGTK